MKLDIHMNGSALSKFNILLLTNRDSDNVGDQIIEACDISLIQGIMKNLGIASDAYTISSRAAGIISRKYMKTRDESLLLGARKAISAANLVVFGGAPLFNYAYQNFYLRTIKTVELAQEYGVPVVFSSIGVEPFDANNAKSRALKKALALPVVKQMTTRDDIDSLKKYAEGTDTPVARVADPAVLADIVFRTEARAVQKTGAGDPAQAQESKKVIGLVVTRAGIFKDNKIDFSEADQREFWRSTIALLEKKGYDYRLFTTGHFTDEVFLDSLVRADGLPVSKAAVTVNSPEELIDQLRACAGVIAYRLHANITSFAMGIPSIGLSWNFKIPHFYQSVGLPHRSLAPENWNADAVVNAIEEAMREGVAKDEEFLMSVYRTLFFAVKGVVAPDTDFEPYSYAELRTELPPYAGTSRQMYRSKMTNKLRRAYEEFQRQREHIEALTAEAPGNSHATEAPTPRATRSTSKRIIGGVRRRLRTVLRRTTKAGRS